jgi:transitional endoplasmic reticulum ATPase
MDESSLAALREALRVSPDNAPLRKHLAETLLRLNRLTEAEQEYQAGLRRDPDNQELKIGLAKVYYQAGKNSHALVIVEDYLKRPETPAAAYLLQARLMIRAGHIERGVQAYKEAIDLDPALEDPILEEQLGVRSEHNEDADLVDGRIRLPTNDGGVWSEVDIERPRISFKDVGGMNGIKEEIRLKIIHPLEHPEIYQAYGKSVGGGILMYGPPGCGKTYLARATAGEVKASFISVGLHDVLDMWIGASERNLHDLFENARANKPCVLFFDEADALGAKRSDMRQSSGRQLINQFLSELDGLENSNEGVLILAATNAPWHLDSAFRRPGRFDRILFVPPPDAPARAAILRILLTGKPTQDVDFDHIAKKTDSFSGADLKGLVDVAIERKLTEAVKKGAPSPIVSADLLKAARTVRQSTKEWFSTARNYALYSNQGGMYDDILKHLNIK